MTGWVICCKWKDGSTSWEKLSNCKESSPIQVAKYARSQGTDHDPAFNWWVPCLLKRRDRRISMMKLCSAQHLNMTHKIGLKLPKTVDETIVIIENNRSTL